MSAEDTIEENVSRAAEPVGDRHSERRRGWSISSYGPVLAFATTVVAYCLGWAALGTYPFSDRPRGMGDQVTQIVPFHKYLWDVFHGEAAGDLFFTWQTGFGQQFLSNYHTYLGNPLSLLSVLVPREHVDLAVFAATPLTMGLAAAAMTVFLGRLASGSPAMRAVLGSCYALCGWAVGDGSYLPMWLWGLFSLPLLCLAVQWCLQGRRWLGATGLIALAWLGNYYTAMMATFAAGIVLLIRLAAVELSARERILVVLRAGTAVPAGVLLTMPLLLPSFLSSRAAQPTTAPDFVPAGNDIFFATMLPGTYVWGPQPRLYIASLGLVLALTFVANRRIPVRSRLVWTTGVVLVTASFQWAPTQFVWHGLAVPNGNPYREAFVFAGLLTMLAWMSLAARPTVPVTVGAALVPVLVAVLVRNSPDFGGIVWYTVLGGGALAVVALALLAVSGTPDDRNGSRRAVAVLGVVLMFGGVIAESAMSVRSVEERRARERWAGAGTTSGAAVQEKFRVVQRARGWPEYRTDPNSDPGAANDSATLRAEGPQYYSSYTPETTTAMLDGLGFGWRTSGRTIVSLDNPVTDAIFGIGARVYRADQRGTEFTARRFPAPPLVTVHPAEPGAGSGSTPADTVFARQEAMLGATVYQVPAVRLPTSETVTVSSGENRYQIRPRGKQARLTVTAACRPGTGVYWYSPRLNGPLAQNGTQGASVGATQRARAGMVPLGTVPASGEVEVVFEPDGAGTIPRYPIGCLDRNRLRAAVDRLTATGATEVLAGGHSIEATLPAGSTGVAVLAVPAADGWRCGPSGGSLIEPQKRLGLLAVPLEPGVAGVRCVFTPPGFRPGLAVAGLVVLVVGAVQVVAVRRRRRLSTENTPALRRQPARQSSFSRVAGPSR